MKYNWQKHGGTKYEYIIQDLFSYLIDQAGAFQICMSVEILFDPPAFLEILCLPSFLLEVDPYL